MLNNSDVSNPFRAIARLPSMEITVRYVYDRMVTKPCLTLFLITRTKVAAPQPSIIHGALIKHLFTQGSLIQRLYNDVKY